MADEAFALSPISARAAEPREEDYDAISSAFMETSRGRWFLGEYAKRNRNADTRMVLDAVARIERNIAAQKQVPSDNKLAEALTALRAAVDAARTSASDALDGLAVEDKLIPLRKGARIIHEIAWRWREIGADGRICDLLDAQVRAIDTSCEEITALDARIAFHAAFDLIQGKIEALAAGAGHHAPAAASAETSPSTESGPESAEASGDMTAAFAQTTETSEAGFIQEDLIQEDFAEEDLAQAATTEMPGARAEASYDVNDDAYDEAILDAVALEMAIADPVEPKRVTPAAERAPAKSVPKFDDVNDLEIHFVDSPEESAVAAPSPVAQKIVAQNSVEREPVAPQQHVAAQEKTAPPANMAPPQPVMSRDVVSPALEMVRARTAEIAAEISMKSAPEPAVKQPGEISFEVPPDASQEMSLGSSLIANGIVKKPSKIPAADPFAAIRRLSQAEKIALFS